MNFATVSGNLAGIALENRAIRLWGHALFHDQDLPADIGLDANIGELADTGARSPLPETGSRPDLRPILLRPCGTHD
ncbi:hypothetical protein, partial [Methylorubrum zatmanii]|uniref:hypothetical protein n=1 Tax=Methylorubrum zatmanii TaxID=29429 RepID=UPI001AEE441B